MESCISTHLSLAALTAVMISLLPATPTPVSADAVKAIQASLELPTKWEEQPFIKQLEAELEARRALQKPKPVIHTTPIQKPVTKPVVKPSGNCSEWLALAGVDDVASAIQLINRESGCNPNAVNPYSGACGIPQELPCGKSGCGSDPVCQIKWMDRYCKARYGSWAGALQFQISRGWY